jgi:hypothetical protein
LVILHAAYSQNDQRRVKSLNAELHETATLATDQATNGATKADENISRLRARLADQAVIGQ